MHLCVFTRSLLVSCIASSTYVRCAVRWCITYLLVTRLEYLIDVQQLAVGKCLAIPQHTLGHESNGIGYFIPVKYIITHMTWWRAGHNIRLVCFGMYRMCSRSGKSLSLNFVPLTFIVCAAQNNIPRYFLILPEAACAERILLSQQ